MAQVVVGSVVKAYHRHVGRSATAAAHQAEGQPKVVPDLLSLALLFAPHPPTKAEMGKAWDEPVPGGVLQALPSMPLGVVEPAKRQVPGSEV